MAHLTIIVKTLLIILFNAIIYFTARYVARYLVRYNVSGNDDREHWTEYYEKIFMNIGIVNLALWVIIISCIVIFGILM